VDGIDQLLNGGASEQTAPATGLDMLLKGGSAPAPLPVATNPTQRGSITGGLIQGVNDVQDGAAQWLYNSLPKSIQDAGDSVDHWVYDKTSGAMGTKPGMTFNASVADKNKQYEAARAGNGRDGIDWARGIGAGGAQAALTPFLPQMGAMRAGAMSGALSPVLDDKSGADYAQQKAADVGLGGVMGGFLGSGANALAGLIKPQINTAARTLANAGVSLTPGQMLGGFPKSVEDKLTSVPLIGDAIKAAQARGTESLNTATYKRVLQPLADGGFDVSLPKSVGREAVDSISNQVSGAYNSLLPKLTTHMDPQFSQDVGRLSQMVNTGNLGEAESKQFNAILQSQVLDKFMGPKGTITGETLKQMESNLGDLARSNGGQPLGGAVKELQANIRSLVQRTNPEYASQLTKINESFANLTRVQTAAATQGAPNGVFNANQLSAAVKSGDSTVRDNAFARGNALMQDLSDPAKGTLSSSVPDSGTAGRLGAMAGVGALLSHPAMLADPKVLGGAALAALPAAAYTRQMLPIVQKALLNRPVGAQQAADLVRRGASQSAPALTGGLLGPASSELSGINWPWASPRQ